MRATLTRVAAFYFFASAYWALLPLVASTRVAGGPAHYGLLLGAIGVGAICGAFGLDRLHARFGPDRLVALGTAGTSVGQIAGLAGLSIALFIAAAGAMLSIPVTWRWKLQTGAKIDFTPSMHWPAPPVVQDVEQTQGPVMVTVEYRILAEDREAFLVAVHLLSRERRRDGAFAWVIVEDVAQTGKFVETFFLESWLEHLHQHARVTKTDRTLEDRIRALHQGPAPATTHYISAKPKRRLTRRDLQAGAVL